MAICNHLAPNGEKSLLYQNLEGKYGPDKAHDIWAATRSQQFLNKHGDWTAGSDSPFFGNVEYMTEFGKVHLDGNGEPTMDWVDQQFKLVEERIEIKPGMYANAGQSDTIKNIMEFLKPDYTPAEKMNSKLAKYYLLEGGAGVGKTTSINRALKDFRGTIIGATVSAEAQGILQQNMVGKETMTIAKLLGLVYDTSGEKAIFRKRNEKEEKEFRFQRKSDPIESAKVLIIDEASMIDGPTWALIESIKPEDTKVIFLGDRTQLPPIGEVVSPVFVKLTDTPNYSKLIETMRFAEGAPIFQVTERMFADNIRTQQETGTLPEKNPLNKSDFVDQVNDKEAVLYRSYSSSLLKDIAKEFQDATGSKDVIVIADTNKYVAEINSLIRNIIYDGKTEEDYKIGERVRMAEAYVESKMVLAENNLKGIVKHKRQGEISGVPTTFIDIEFDRVIKSGEIKKFTQTIPIVNPESQQQYKTELARLLAAAKADKSQWRYFYAFKEMFGSIDYAYAMTTHKVQGSTFKNVYVMESEIFRAKSPRTALEQNQMMRTATSRPTTKLVIVTDKITNTDTTLVDIKAKEVPAIPVESVAPTTEPAPIITEPVINKEPTGTEYKLDDGPAVEKLEGKIVTLGKSSDRISEEAMAEEIKDLYAKAAADPLILYKVPYEYQGEKRVLDNGYGARELANIMDNVGEIPPNIAFTPSFKTMVENSYRRIIEGFGSGVPVEFINRDDKRVLETANQILIQKTGTDGKPAGYFTPQEQKDIVDTVAAMSERALRKDPLLKSNAILKVFIALNAKKDQLVKTSAPLAEHFTSIINQRVRIVEETLHKLQGMGLSMDAKTIENIKAAVEQIRTFSEEEKAALIEANPDIDPMMDTNTGEFLEAVGKISSNWGDNTFELDPKDTASARIKLFMGTLYEADRGVYSIGEDGTNISNIDLKEVQADPARGQVLANRLSRQPFWHTDAETSHKLADYLTRNFPLVPELNFLNLPVVADSNEIFKETMNILGDKLQTTTFDEAMAMLGESTNPTIQKMAQELSKPDADQALQNEFMTVMSKQYQRFITAKFKKSTDQEGRESMILTPIKSNRYGQRETLIKQWQENQKLGAITVFSPAGDRILDSKRIENDWMPVLEYARSIQDWSLPENKRYFIEEFGYILNELGIGVTEEMMAELFKNPQYWSSSTSVTGLFENVKGTNVPAGLFSIFISKAAGRANSGEIVEDDLEKIRLSQMNNPLYTETSLMQKLAKLYAKFQPVLYSSNHRNAEGKSVYDWGMNTKLSHTFREFSLDYDHFEQFAAKMDDVIIARNNWLIKALRNTPAQIDRIELNYFDGMKKENSDRGTTREAMSDREQLLMSINLFQNRANGFNRIPQVNYMSLTHGDKTMTPIFHGMPRLSTGAFGTMPNGIIGDMESAMFGIFNSEYQRIKEHRDIKFNNKQYEKGKGIFFQIPDFNLDGMKALVASGVITEDELKLIYPNGEKELTEIISDDIELPVINKVLANFTKNLVQNTLRKWRENGIVKDESTLFDKQYLWKVYGENGLRRNKDGTFKNSKGQAVSIKDATTIIAGYAAKDYAINHFLFNTSLSQLFYGDMAESYKAAPGGKTVLDHVESTFIEYTKRLAKDIAPSTDMYWGDDRSYNTITLADVKTVEKYLKDVVDIYATSPTNSTDAQEVTTVKEQLNVMFAAGKIPTTTHQEMLAIIDKAGPGGYYEFKVPEHRAIVMQPQKPVFAGTRTPDRGAMFTDYIKSSSWALYPPFTKGKEIDKLRVFMEKNDIQRANFESAKKLGNPTTPLAVFDDKGRWIEPGENWTEAYEKLDRSGFGLQQEVPHDPEKEAIKILTQMNENITEGISKLEGFNLPGLGTLSGKQVKALKETIRKKMIEYNLHELHEQLNVDTNGVVDLEILFDIMTDRAKTDIRNSYTTNEVQSMLIRNPDGTPAIPPMFNTAADRFETMLMSIMNGVSEIKMPGKSYVQASSAGIQLSEDADLSQVVSAGDWDGSALKTLRIEDGVVKPGQVIMPFNFFDTDGNKLKLSDYVVDGKVDMSKLPVEALQLIAGRIPNQKHSSMLPVEIVGFVPEELGDIAFVPAALVKQMGSDFDVDKLYTYKRPYNVSPITGAVTPIATNDNKTGLQTAYFDVHWAILTHPEMLSKVLQPLDIDDLKDESTLLKAKRGDYMNYYDQINQLDDFQRGKEAKRLVGQTSWAVKFDARIQDKNLRFSKWVEIEENGVTSLVEQDAFISVKDEQTGEIRRLGKLSGTGISWYAKKKGDVPEARDKGTNHVMTQSESVDNMKNRTLDNLNLTPETYKAVQALMQLQTDDDWAANSKYWTRLTTQPVIWEFSRLMKQGNDSLSDSYDPVLYTSTISALKSKYESTTEAYDTSEIVFDPELLLNTQKMSGDEFNKHQLAALELFDKLYQIGNRMFILEAQFNQDVSGSGPSLLQAMDKNKAMADLEQPPIKNAMELFTDGKELTEVGVTYNATVINAINLVNQVFPYKPLTSLFDKISWATGRQNLSIDQQKKVLRALRSATFTTGEHFWFEAQSERVRLIYGEDSIAKRLAKAKAEWGIQNPFLQSLNTVIGATKTAPDWIEYRAAGKTSTVERQARTSGWLHILLSEVPEQRMLGEDLLRYAYLTGGIQDANSFIQFLPVSYIVGTEFGKMLKDTEANLKSTDAYENDGLVIQFMQHNPELAQQVDPVMFGKLTDGSEFPESFEITEENRVLPESANMKNVGGEFLPFLSFRSRMEGKSILYMKNPVGDVTMYTRIDTLGNQYMDEYNGEAEAGQRSVLQENRAMADIIPSIINNDELQSLGDFKDNAYGYKNFDNGISHYDQLNIRTGGLQAAINGLNTIANHEYIPQYMRLTAKFLAKTSPSEEYMQANMTVNVSNILKPFILVVKNDINNGAAGTSSYDNKVELNSSMTYNLRDAAGTLIHEMMHNKTQHMLFMTGNDIDKLRSLPDNVQKAYQKEIDKYRAKYPGATKAADELGRIRYEAYNSLRIKLGDARFEDIKAEVESGIMSTPEHELYYAFHNTSELVAHVFENRVTAQYLNEVQSSKGGTILSQIWEALSEMLAAIGQYFGFTIKERSLLKEAVINTMRLVDIKSSESIDFTEALATKSTMNFDTEHTAKIYEQLVRDTYGKKTELESDGLNWKLTFSDYKKPTRIFGQRGKILDKLYEQKNEIYNSKNNLDPVERVKLMAKYREIKEQIQTVRANNNLDVITAIAKRQLEWVDETLKHDSPTTVEVNLALNVTHTWENLLRILYGDDTQVNEVNKEFGDIQVEATRRRIELLNSKAREVLNRQFEGYVTLSDQDYGKELKDIDMLSANVLVLTRAKPLLVQAVAVLGKTEAGNRDEHIYRNTIKLQELDKKMKAAGLDPNNMIQLSDDGSSWGLVSRLSSSWYTDTAAARDMLEEKLEGIDSSDAFTDEDKIKKKRALLDDYWNKLKSKAAFVDTRAFFDVATGAQLSGTLVDKALARLTELVGSEEYAKELITQASNKYKEYLESKEAMKLHLLSTVSLTEEERGDKNADEQTEVLDKKISEQMKKWLQYNSPTEFLKSVENDKSIRLNSEGDKWIVMAPRKESKDYYDDRFTKISEDPKMLEAYNEYKSVLNEMISYLPIEIQSQLPDNFLPIVPKDTANWLAQVLGKIRNWDTTMLNALTATDAEEASRLRPNKIPVMYTNPTNLTKDVGDRSTDLIRLLEVFSMMALQHKYMGNVLDTINIAENVLKEIDNRRLNGQETGKPLRNLRDALKYFKDAMIFKKPKELEGKINSAMYSLNPATQTKIQNEIKDLYAEKEKLEVESMEFFTEGKLTESMALDKRIDVIDKKLTEYEKQARYIYGSKIADVMISINQQKALSYNPFSAVSNFSFGVISAFIHANSGVDYDNKTMTQAWGVMTHSMKKYWLFNEMGDETAQKVHALMNRYGIMGDIVDSQYGESNLANSKKGTFRNAISPYNWQRSGDYFTKGMLMVAMMKKKKVPVTEADGTVKEIPLWEALDSSGKWNTEKYGENKAWYSENDVHEQTESNKYREQIRHISTMVFGNQDKNSPLMAKKSWLWRLAGQFRMSWFPEGIATRFKGEYQDINLGRQVKGRWKTYADIGILNSGLLVCKQMLAALPGVKMDPFDGTIMQGGLSKGKALSDSPVDMENMRKNFAGLAWTIAITATILMIRASTSGDKRRKKTDDDRKLQLLINMLIRNQQDLQLYSSPAVFNTISGNFIPATQVLVDYWIAMKATSEYLLTDTSGDKDAGKRLIKKITRAGIPHPSATLYNKVEVMLTRDLDKLQR